MAELCRHAPLPDAEQLVAVLLPHLGAVRFCELDHVGGAARTLARLLVPQCNQRDIGVGPQQSILHVPDVAALKHTVILDPCGPWWELVAIPEDDRRVLRDEMVELLHPVRTPIGDRLAPVGFDRDRQAHLGRYTELLANFVE